MRHRGYEKKSESNTFCAGTEYVKENNKNLLHSSDIKTCEMAVIALILIVVTVIPCTVDGSLQITENEYPLMQYTKLISEEHFAAGRPLVILLATAKEDSADKEVGHLIEELHTPVRWPILVYDFSRNVKLNMYNEIHQHGSYILLVSGTCKEGQEYISRFWQEVYELSVDDKTWLSWNPRTKFVVSVISNCTHLDNTHISRAILSNLWLFGVINAIVLFLKSNEHAGNDLQQNTTDSAQSTYLELHTWYPYENSDRCNPAEGTVPVKVFRVRNFIEIGRKDIFRKYFNKNLHGCPLNVHVEIKPPFVYPPKSIWQKDSGYRDVYVDGLEIELLRMIGYSLNASLDIEDSSRIAYRNTTASLYLGGYGTYSSALDYLTEQTRSYLNVHFFWYTPCAVKYQRWSRFFNIFSVDMWICFALSLVLAVVTVRCISNYGHISHLHESTSYSNIFSVTSNIISVVLSVSVNTQSHSAPLRLLFFCWMRYSVAYSKVFQAYFTTYLIEPGYKEPIRTVEHMVKSERKFGFIDEYEVFFNNVPGSVDSAILNKSVRCPDRGSSFNWAAIYQNISVVFDDMNIEICRDMGKLTDENKRPLLCELEDGGVEAVGLVLLVIRGSPLLEFINDIIEHIIESGIVTHIKKRDFHKEKIVSVWDAFVLYDTYTVFGIGHLQTAFYLLMLGYVVALASFVIEIMWHRYMSKGSKQTCTCLGHG